MAEKLTLEQQNEMLSDIASKVGIINDRLRLIEERSHQNREKIRSVEENLVIKFKDNREDVKRLNLEVDELRKNVNNLTKTLQRMVKELAETAKINDVKVLDKVMDYFDPTRFLTEKDIKRIIKQNI